MDPSVTTQVQPVAAPTPQSPFQQSQPQPAVASYQPSFSMPQGQLGGQAPAPTYVTYTAPPPPPAVAPAVAPAVTATNAGAATTQALNPMTGITLTIGWLSGLAILAALIVLLFLSIYGIAAWFRRTARETELAEICRATERKKDEISKLTRYLEEDEDDDYIDY